MIGKIFYDNIIRTRAEWDKSLFALAKGFPDIKLPDLGDLPELEAFQSHYFAILNNNHKEIRFAIRNQVKKKLGRWQAIVWDFNFSEGNSEFYRIDCPREVVIYRKAIYSPQIRWTKDKHLHSKGPRAIRNLVGKLNSGEI